MKKLMMVILGVIFLVSCSGKTSATFDLEATKGAKFPAFTAKSIDGKETFKSTDLLKSDKKTLFVIAAEWCPHCRDEAIEIQEFYEKHKDEANIVVIYSANNSSPEIVTEYLTKNKYTFPAYYDHDNVILYGSKIESFPFNAVIGKDGKIEEIVEGELSYDSLVEKLTK